jgi:hypothetical protein
MVNITTHSSPTNNGVLPLPVSAATPAIVLSSAEKASASNALSHPGTTTDVSTLARQLSEAATRAEARHDEKASGALDLITGNGYVANKAQHDAEVPEESTPQLLARAQQATAFVNGAGSNPFKGLSSDQLNLIAHDEGGAFTINERRAAWQEVQSTDRGEPASVSGRGLMISRLFGRHEPPVAEPPLTRSNVGQSAFDFLTRDDRALLSEMYTYAQAQGADLRHVDNLAYELGDYRHHSDGRQRLSVNSGKGFDSEGYLVTIDFNEQDAATASRILNGSAISSTRIDQGFLRHFLDPGYGAALNVSGLAFLEQMVIKYSVEGAKQTALDSKFATYTSISVKDNAVFTTHKDVKAPPFKPHATGVDGVWTLTEEGKAAGYTLDKATGRLSASVYSLDAQAPQHVPAGQRPSRTLMESLSDTPDPPATRWVWPGHLFRMLKTSNPER